MFDSVHRSPFYVYLFGERLCSDIHCGADFVPTLVTLELRHAIYTDGKNAVSTRNYTRAQEEENAA